MENDTEPGITTRVLEAVTALFFIVLGAIVISDSLRVGNDWGDDGPKAGYFPFYIGCILAIAGLFVLFTTIKNWRSESGQKPFASYGELKLVLAMFIPTVVYVLGVTFLGLYISSTVFIVAFMMWQGKYHWAKSVAVGVGVSLALYFLFERWFLVPLPKGPWGF